MLNLILERIWKVQMISAESMYVPITKLCVIRVSIYTKSVGEAFYLVDPDFHYTETSSFTVPKI